MNQALEDLKGDIQTLIDTTAETITSLVDEMAKRASLPQTASNAMAGDGNEFTSQIEELRSKVRAATDSLKQQTSAALSAVTITQSTPVGGNSSGSVLGKNSDGTPNNEVGGTGSAQDSAGVVVGPDSFKSGA